MTCLFGMFTIFLHLLIMRGNKKLATVFVNKRYDTGGCYYPCFMTRHFYLPTHLSMMAIVDFHSNY